MSTVPGGRKTAQLPPGGVASIVAINWVVLAIVVKPLGPGISGGMGGAEGGSGGADGIRGDSEQAGMSTPAAAHEAGHRSPIRASLEANGANGMGQPMACAFVSNSAILMAHNIGNG